MKPTKKPAKSAKKKSSKPAPIANKRVLSIQPGRERDTPRPRRDPLDPIPSTPAAAIPSTPPADKPASELPLSLVSAPDPAEELAAEAAHVLEAAERQLWRRGKLPGEKLVKTNRKTGEVVAIGRDEWNRLY